MTDFIVAIAEAFPADVTAGTHEGVVVPLGTVPHAFTCKITLPNLIVPHEEIHDGGGIFDDAPPSGFVGLPLIILPLSIVPWRGGEFGHWLFRRGIDKSGGKDHIEGADEYHLKNFVKTNEAVIDH